MILVTGASGFIGSAVAATAALRGMAVRAAVRRPPAPHQAHAHAAPYVLAPDLAATSDWSRPLLDVDVVVHTAARVHVMKDVASDPLAEYRRINVAGTLSLARQAAAAGARRFVFLSSIKVNGEHTTSGAPFTASEDPAPIDPYGVSKLEAERGLLKLQSESGMEVVVIRPVLVYGPGVKANFATMMRWLTSGVPLPLGAVHNKRSIVALPNLVDLILTCTNHPSAGGHTFLVSDGEDLSTTALLKRLATALGTKANLVRVPQRLLRIAARAVGRENVGRRLCDSLQVDISPTTRLLGWTPPISVDRGLEETARDFLSRRSER